MSDARARGGPHRDAGGESARELRVHQAIVSTTRRTVLRAVPAGLAAALLLVACDDDPATKPTTSSAFEPGPLPTLDLEPFGGGDPVDLAGLRGPMVINLWATWCTQCRHEMPVLEEFHQRAGEKVALLGIAYQETHPDEARALVERLGVTYDLLDDPDGELNNLRPFPPIRALPMTALVDEQGRLVYVEAMEIETVDELAALVEEHLGVTV